MFTWFLLPALLLSATPQDPYTPLRLYNGPWTITMRDQASGKTTTDALINSCSLAGRYFTCQQTVNGKISALVIFIPAAEPDHYTQNVCPSWATGRGELTISATTKFLDLTILWQRRYRIRDVGNSVPGMITLE